MLPNNHHTLVALEDGYKAGISTPVLDSGDSFYAL
jgi:hypothetical protein